MGGKEIEIFTIIKIFRFLLLGKEDERTVDLHSRMNHR
jgi:hypothetical protein